MGERRDRPAAGGRAAVITGSSAPLPRTPRWRRELRILRRDGLYRYLRGVRAIRRFNRSVSKLP